MIVKARITKNPKRVKPWIVRWFGDLDPLTGKQRHYSKSFESAREARKFLTKKQAEIDSGGASDDARGHSLGQLVAEFKKLRLPAYSRSAGLAYERCMNQLVDYFGNTCLLVRIRQQHAEGFIASRRRLSGAERELSPGARGEYIRLAAGLFATAVGWGWIVSNPFKAPRRGALSPLRIQNKTRPWHHLVPHDFRRLIAVVDDVQTRASYWLMYGCGLRPGEAYNLTVDLVDLNALVVNVVARPPTPDIPPFAPKTGRPRTVPLPSPALPDILEAMKESFQSSGFLCLTPRLWKTVQERWRRCYRGEPWLNGHARKWQTPDMALHPNRIFARHLVAAGIRPTYSLTLHTLRKSFAQNHANNSTPIKTLAELLGHSNIATTNTYYQTVTDANRARASSMMSDLLGAKTYAEVTLDVHSPDSAVGRASAKCS